MHNETKVPSTTSLSTTLRSLSLHQKEAVPRGACKGEGLTGGKGWEAGGGGDY